MPPNSISSNDNGAAPPFIASSVRQELAQTSRLGLPLALGQIAWMSTYIVDALMIGRLPHSALSIAASSLGNTIFSAVAFCIVGLLTGLQTLTAQAYGRGDHQKGLRTLGQAVLIVIALSPIVMAAVWMIVELLPLLQTPADIVGETRRYVAAFVWSAPALLLYWCVRRYLQSSDRVIMITASLLIAGLVNFLADWLFLYGPFGLPRLGIAGSGWATCVVRTVSLLLLLAALKKDELRYLLRGYAIDRDLMRRLLRIGWPAAIESFADLGVSTLMSILCARLGARLLAAHQVVLDLDAVVYMVPLGLSYATAVRVGQGAGRGSVKQAGLAANGSLILALGYIGAASILFGSFRYFWAGLYTNDKAVIAAAAPLFLICVTLQIGDAVGIVMAGAFVGTGATRIPLAANLFWYWLVGMPLGYWLTFHNNWSVEGLWTGRASAALGSAATLWLVWRWRLRDAPKTLAYAENLSV